MRIGSGLLSAVAVVGALWPLQAEATLVLSPDGITVYDNVNKITWLAVFNLAATNQFGLPLCNASGASPCVNQSGSMSYTAAAAWVAAMNAANYLGHTNWQLPTTPALDTTGCQFTGTHGNSFGFLCSAGALGSLYYDALGLKAPNAAVAVPNYTVGPFSNLQPYYYWSQTPGTTGGYATFSFNTGFQDSNQPFNFMYVLPMIPGKLPGTPAPTGQALQVNPGGQTVYDPQTNVTWLSNGNLAAVNSFALPACTDQNTPKLCVGKDGAMSWNSASQFVANMNIGAGYLGQTNWQLPPVDPSCPNYGCDGGLNPMGTLYYDQFGFSPGTPVVVAPNVAVGPFHNIQPNIYWGCQADTIQSPCGPAVPATGFEWSFSFDNGFLGTDIVQTDYYATAYFVGSPTAATGPEVAEVANAEGDSPTIAPNTWVEILGANLGPANDVRTWQASDFVGGQMPTKLDGVAATVNGQNAFVEYISPTQVNILTPPDAISGTVQVQLTNNGATAAVFTAEAQSLSPSFFVFPDSYVAAVHLNRGLIGPATLYPGYTTPAKPGEIIVLYANGFGVASTPVVSGSDTQSGTLSTLPVIKIGGVKATVGFAGLVATGEYQFNVTLPATLPNGDQTIIATYGGATTQAGVLITIHD